MGARVRNHVTVAGREGGRPMVFAHGFGCDQNMWRLVAPAFAEHYQLVLFDHVGAGRSDLAAWHPERYACLSGYASDVGEICAELDLHDVIFVGHSVSAMIGVLAAVGEPSRFTRLVLVGPSPCYLDVGSYRGGFSAGDIEELLDSLDSNYLGWSGAMAPIIMGNPDRPELAQELTNSFCRTDPEIARHFARVTFLSDNRDDLAHVTVPTLVLQCRSDVIASTAVGEFVHREIRGSAMVVLDATGHCPQLSAPQQVTAAISAFLHDAQPAAPV